MKPWEVEQEWLRKFGRRVQTICYRRRLTLPELAKLSGVPYPTLYGYVHLGKKVTGFSMFRIARALGVSLSELAGEAEYGGPRADTISHNF